MPVQSGRLPGTTSSSKTWSPAEESTGLTAGDYFQRKRIHRACHRLLTTKVTATEIAHLLGYADSAHFNRRFKETTGLTPRAYRKKFGVESVSVG